jgi:hypothetical protein
MARVMYGQNARQVPCWMYVQHQGASDGTDTVGIIGASRVPVAPGAVHPLRYGTDWAHHFIVGEIIVRPHIVIGSNALQGYGAGNLYLGEHEFGAMLADGELVTGSPDVLRRVRHQWEG